MEYSTKRLLSILFLILLTIIICVMIGIYTKFINDTTITDKTFQLNMMLMMLMMIVIISSLFSMYLFYDNKGERGDKGYDGRKGNKGDVGDTGDRGDIGDPGENGPGIEFYRQDYSWGGVASNDVEFYEIDGKRSDSTHGSIGTLTNHIITQSGSIDGGVMSVENFPLSTMDLNIHINESVVEVRGVDITDEYNTFLFNSPIDVVRGDVVSLETISSLGQTQITLSVKV